ncbi:CDP-glycerol glycerophosphotransferase family protein [Thalassotalea sp. PS06]|uniref:CDP-glycerol glycerophosphotransferase family protein n=1 Tax=Thalassotalea sp. PS06 TaxID=2594005 RepID=UPI0011620429|nr:CDP-glycerol glycerophosphotransferase family protein [Thalassotalea sp. PS06]QDP02272.1 CDP-glycerol--glycerophosphate glycerophosphotransferase [Thalassotalea sp. PS06]
MACKKYLFYVSQNYSYAILRPVQEEIRRRGDQVKWFLHGPVNPDYLRHDEQRLLTVQDVIDYNPMATLLPGNVVPNFIPGIKVAVFHGFDAGKLNRRGSNDHFQIRNCFDLYCTQGPNTTNRFKALEQQLGHFKVIETGWPALDPLFSNGKTESEANRPTILMCSTFSRNLTCAPHLYDKVRELSQNDRWQWLIQFHPKMDKSIVDMYKGLENENLTFVETDNVIPLLQQADVMVCDTSSVLIMFALQGKPVVTFKNINPQPHLINIKDPERLESAIEQALAPAPELLAELQAYIEATHPNQDGNSSVRVLDAIDEMASGKHPLKAKPANWMRQLKMRRQLNYWKF